jgi:hypothetical protein
VRGAHLIPETARPEPVSEVPTVVMNDDQRTPLRVTGPTRLLGAAHAGVHVLRGGRLHVAGIIRQRLVIDTGGACYVSGYIRADPKGAAGGSFDMTGRLNPAAQT